MKVYYDACDALWRTGALINNYLIENSVAVFMTSPHADPVVDIALVRN